MGTVIQLYAGATPADAMASIDVPADGNLVGIDWTVIVAASGADFSNAFQVSFGSTSSFTSNDGRAAISVIRIATDLTTSGAAVVSASKYVRLPDLPVGMGERIYLHGAGTAIVQTANALLHFDFDLDRPRARVR